MIYNVTQDVLELIDSFSLMNKNEIELRDFERSWSPKDKRLRQVRYFHSASTFTTQGFINFEVPSKSGCKCSWPSAFGTFDVNYHIYQTKSKLKFFVYLKAIIFNQKCRKHGNLGEPYMSDEDLQNQVCRSFWTHLTSQLSVPDNFTLQEQKLREQEFQAEKSKRQAEEEKTKQKYAGVEKMSEKYFQLVIEDFENKLLVDQQKKDKEKETEKERRFQFSEGKESYATNYSSVYNSGAKTTKGKHVVGLCEACKRGVCFYGKKLFTP